jgi:DNA mismatch endonuclease (patch repair protein)
MLHSKAPKSAKLVSPSASSAAVRAVMIANKKTGSSPEVTLRSHLHLAGLRFRKNHTLKVDELRITPDVVFPRQKLAIFVDGCFWHRCPKHGTDPRSNADYWSLKLARNVERDRRTGAALRKRGWKVVRIWEHEDPSVAARRIESILLGLRAVEGRLVR